MLRKTDNGLAGVLSAVCAGENRHHFAKNSIPDEIREPINNRPANISMNNLINEWRLGKSINNLRNLGMEFSAETTLLRLVPELRFSNVEFGRATYLDFVTQRSSRSRRALTSGHGL